MFWYKRKTPQEQYQRLLTEKNELVGLINDTSSVLTNPYSQVNGRTAARNVAKELNQKLEKILEKIVRLREKHPEVDKTK